MFKDYFSISFLLGQIHLSIFDDPSNFEINVVVKQFEFNALRQITL